MAVADTFDQVIQRADATRGNDGHLHGIGHRPRQGNVITGLGPVAIHGGEQNFAGAKRDEIVVELYRPRPLQADLHRSLKRFNVLVAHRRFGKTVFCVNELIARAAANRLDRPRYAYVAPLFTQAKDVAWDYLKRFTAAIPDVEASETELRVDLPGGARIRLYGADNPDRLRGLYLDGVVLDEYAQIHPRLWAEVVRPALADRQGEVAGQIRRLAVVDEERF